MGDGGAGDADREKPFYFKQTKCMSPSSPISRAACSGATNPPSLAGGVGLCSPAFAKQMLYAGKGARISPVGAGAAGWAGRVQLEQEVDQESLKDVTQQNGFIWQVESHLRIS